MNEKITKDMTIKEIFYKFPEQQEALSEVLMNVGLSCMGCAAAQFETLEQGLLAHGKTTEEVEKTISDLNLVASK